MAEALNLKPCPFCGGAAEIYQVGNDHLKRRGFEVKCTTWGCSTKKTALVIRHTLQDARRFAVEAWNRRSEPEALRLLGEVEKALEPFAAYARVLDAVKTDVPDNHRQAMVWSDGDDGAEADVTAGAFRRASLTHKAISGGGE